MIKIAISDLRRAASLADLIGQLEEAREAAQDIPVDVPIGVKQSPQYPMGSLPVSVVVSANDIRAKLVSQLAPLYDELRKLGIEIDR